MRFTTLNFEQKNGIGLLTINRPEALNALRSDLLSELDHFCQQIIQTELRCLIITGSGNKAFVAGADIKEMQQLTPEQAKVFAQNGQRTFDRIADLPFTSIAAVNGFALGGGCELSLACDIRFASDNAKFGQPEVNLGVIPGFGGTQRLPRLIGKGLANELLFSGNIIDAEEAQRIGLINRIFPQESLLDECRKLAATICSRSPAAVRLCKEVVNNGVEMDLARGCSYEADLFALCFSNEEQKEGMAAFLEKRQANFDKK